MIGCILSFGYGPWLFVQKETKYCKFVGLFFFQFQAGLGSHTRRSLLSIAVLFLLFGKYEWLLSTGFLVWSKSLNLHYLVSCRSGYTGVYILHEDYRCTVHPNYICWSILIAYVASFTDLARSSFLPPYTQDCCWGNVMVPNKHTVLTLPWCCTTLTCYNGTFEVEVVGHDARNCKLLPVVWELNTWFEFPCVKTEFRGNIGKILDSLFENNEMFLTPCGIQFLARLWIRWRVISQRWYSGGTLCYSVVLWRTVDCRRLR